MNPSDETIKLYDDDAYATVFDAVVLAACDSSKKETAPVYELLLDRTLFFPEEGGQSPDTGILCVTSAGTEYRFHVIDVQIKQNQIFHFVTPADSENAPLPQSVDLKKAPLPQPGDTAHGEIDWNHRFSNMQQHSGEHIFSGIVHEKFGFDNVGFHLSDQTVTMDYNGVLTPENVTEIELLVNRVITKNVEITAKYPTAEELKSLDYRSKKEIEGRIRIVTITGVDVCACCAPHVKRTGEIGILKVMQLQNYKGGVRLTILCGFRALDAFSKKQAVLSGLTNFLTTSEDTLLDSVTKLKASLQQAKYDLSSAQRTYLFEKAASLPESQENVFFFEAALEQSVARALLNELVPAHSGYCGIFTGGEDGGYSYLIASETMDCAVLAAKMREALHAKGGGTPRMIQGRVTAVKDDILAFFKRVCSL